MTKKDSVVAQEHSTTPEPSGKKPKMKKIAKWVGLSVLTPVAIGIGVLSYGVTLDLTPHKQEISQWLTKNLARETKIEGDIALTLSFSPEIDINKLTIGNTEAMKWQPMLSSGHASAKVSLLPLLRNTLEIDYLKLDNTHVELNRDYQGKPNWVFNSSPKVTTSDDKTSKPLTLKITDTITAKDVSVSYLDQQTGQYFSAAVEQLSLTKPDKWLLKAQGFVQGQSYDFSLTGDLESIINHQQGHLVAAGEFIGARLNIDADIQPWRTGVTHANIDLDWHDTAPIKSFLDLDIGPAAPLKITTKLSASHEGIGLTKLKIDSPVTQASGHLVFALAKKGQPLNYIDGKLDIPLIDLRPWLQPEQPQPMMMSYAAAPPQQSPLQQALDQWLVKTQTHLALKVGEIKGLGTPVHSIALTVDGKQGKLTAPMQANIADVAFTGSANIDATTGLSKVAISLGAKDSQLGEMAGWISGIPNATGHVNLAELNVDTQGTKLQEWIDNSKLALTINKAQLDWGAKVDFAINSAKLIAGMNIPFSSHISGQMMGIPAKIEASAGSLSDIINQRDWQTDFQFISPAITLKAKGQLVGTQWQQGSWFDLDIDSKDAGKLSPWLGTKSTIHGPIQLKGKLTYKQDWVTLEASNINLLRSQGNIDLKWKPTGDMFVGLNSHFSRLDLSQISQFIDGDRLPHVEQTVPTQGVNLDVPILAHGLVVKNADVSVNVDTMKWSKQQLHQLSFTGKMRDGIMPAAPFSANYLGSQYRGDIALKINQNKIASTLNLSVNKPNVGAILNQFNISNDFDFSLRRAQLHLALSGRSMIEFMEQANINAQLIGGHLGVKQQYTGKAFNIELDKGQFITGPNTETSLSLVGQAAQDPVNITLNSVSLKQANDGRKTIPLSLIANIGDIKLNARSQVKMPLDMRKLNLAVEATTPNLNRFNKFTGVELPPYGPIKVAGQLTTDPNGYHLNNMLLQVGSSELTGKGDLLLTHKPQRIRPRINLDLSAPFIQLNDFKVKGWHAWQQESSASKDPQASKPVALMSPDGLKKFDATFSLNVGEVRSGNDWLGAGELDWTLNNGLLTVNPLHIKLPGGEIDLSGSVKAVGDKFDIGLKGKVENFDYGILARRIDPKTTMHGLLSTEFNLHSLANTPESLMNNASGFLGFAVWPKAFQANVVDLWAVSLADAVLPSLTKHDPSVINCVAGGFNINHGTMKQRDLLLDTTRIQVHGTFDANFKQRDFSMYLSPKAKRAQIFGLQTPIEVTGNFNDFNLNIPLSAILETSVRFTTSPVIAPLSWLFEKPIAPNASSECQRIWQGLPQ
ncbi:AsmA family protein [Photobacterium damselae]|uniref:AsmA family protein n=1 Tax=Photobacterium damselae TaxID=38293 RepID=UPI002542D706